MTTPSQSNRLNVGRSPVIVALLLLAAFFIATYHLTRESLWYDEGWTMWVVHDQAKPPESLLQIAQYLKNSLTDTLGRIRGDVHPPLYYLLLDIWALLVGESVYVVRLFSALCGLLALAATYTLGKRLFDSRVGLSAVVILATASFFVYYTREARMYMLLVALSALSTWAYILWKPRPTTRRILLYGLLMALMLYTHYAGVLVVVAHVIHLSIAGILHLIRRRGVQLNVLLHTSLPYLLATLLFGAWIPILIAQARLNNGRPLADALPPEWATIAPLLLIMSSGYWWLYLLPFAVSLVLRLLNPVRESAKNDDLRPVLLLALWLVITPLVLLALNIWATPLFQIRYNIAILPAAALLIATAFRHVDPSPNLNKSPLGVLGVLVVQIFLLLWIAYTQLAMYTEFWPDKPRWNEAIAQMTTARQPLEPAIVDINDSSVAAYYDRVYGIRRYISIDLSWRDHTPEEMQTLVGKLDNSPSVWAVMRSDVPSSWDATALLSGTRGVGYRDSVMNVIFYRFDAGTSDTLTFRFGDLVRYEGGIGHQLYARIGESFCLPVELQLSALQPLDGTYFAGLSLTQGYNTQRSRWDGTLGTHEAGDQINLEPCLDIPNETPRGPHHLRLVLYHENDAKRLPLIEADNLYWGTELMLATVSVDE